ncbi:hypothetical protein ACHAWF_006782 [Thalassiosira exigua]
MGGGGRGGKKKGGRGGGGGRSRGGGGRGGGRAGRGRGRGRGGGPGGGRMGMGHHHHGQPQVRLFSMKQHLLLKCINYLDDASRKSAFTVMGWPLENYEKRKEMMRNQLIHRERIRKEQEEKVKKEAAANDEAAAGDATDACSKDTTEAEGVEGANDKQNAEKGELEPYADKTDNGVVKDDDKKEVVECKEKEGKNEATPESIAQFSEREVKHETPPTVNDQLSKLALSIDQAWGEEAKDKENQETAASDSEPKAEPEAPEEPKTAETEEAHNANAEAKDESNPKGDVSSGGEKAATDDGELADGSKTSSESKFAKMEILPLLFAPPDPDTLLARLNTRRLYQRVLYYQREQRKKLQADAAKLLENEEGKEDDTGINNAYEKGIKDRRTADRVYRKDVTIQQMAEMEWDELLEIAALRNEGKQMPYEPIPTQYELLLFSPCPRAVGVLASYPRSGNSLMRTLYEHTTLRVTGSDMQGGLAKHDLVGEMVRVEWPRSVSAPFDFHFHFHFVRFSGCGHKYGAVCEDSLPRTTRHSGFSSK